MTNSDRYVEESQAGEGGMAVVLRVYDRELERCVAVKRAKAATDHQGDSKELIEQEARFLAVLEHPNIVPVHDLGTDANGQRFYTMKLLVGQPFSDRLADTPPRRRTQLELLSCLRIVTAVCEALDFAHSRSILHLDVKSENVLVGDHGEVHLIDWGISKVARLQGDVSTDRRQSPAHGRHRFASLPCSPFFASPEQAEGRRDEISPRTDVFGVGAMLFEVVTGSPPFEAPTAEEALARAIDCEVAVGLERAPLLPAWLRRIILKAMARDPSDRYESVKELNRDLQDFLDNVWQFNRRTYTKGDTIVWENEPPTTAFLLITGRCEVVQTSGGRSKQLRVLGPGDVFGELALVAGSRRTATVRALERVEVVVLDREELQHDIAGNMWTGKVLQTLVNRFLDKERCLTELEQRQRALAGSIEHLSSRGRRLADGRLVAKWSDLCRSMEGTLAPTLLAGALTPMLLEWIAATFGTKPQRLDRQRVRSGPLVIDFENDQYWVGTVEGT